MAQGKSRRRFAAGVSLFLEEIALLFCIVACVTDEWALPIQYGNAGNTTVYNVGLWKKCHTTGLVEYICTEHGWPAKSVSLQVVRAFSIISLILAFVLKICGARIFFLQNHEPKREPSSSRFGNVLKKIWPGITVVLAIIVSLLCISSFATFTGDIGNILGIRHSNIRIGIGYSAYLMLFAGISSCFVVTIDLYMHFKQLTSDKQTSKNGSQELRNLNKAKNEAE